LIRIDYRIPMDPERHIRILYQQPNHHKRQSNLFSKNRNNRIDSIPNHRTHRTGQQRSMNHIYCHNPMDPVDCNRTHDR
jgi:hypothetical protein